jgi:hypothetical protein
MFHLTSLMNEANNYRPMHNRGQQGCRAPHLRECRHNDDGDDDDNTTMPMVMVLNDAMMPM